MRKHQMAILGAGSVANAMARTVKLMEERGDAIHMYGVASRTMEKAQAFAEKHGIDRAYGSYEDMMNDPEVELVYIATPHAFHAEQMLQCLHHGKAVLCEKAFTANARQAREVLTLARQKGLLVCEGIWTRFLPIRGMIEDIVATGRLGEVKMVTANLGYPNMEYERVIRPDLAGGALLDLGVYTLNFAAMVLGTEVIRTESIGTLSAAGVDVREDIVQYYKNGATAHLHNSMLVRTDRHCKIYGTTAFLETDNVTPPRILKIYNNRYQLEETLEAPPMLTPFEYEVTACIKALDEGRIEVPEMPHREILRIMEQMDELRAQWNMVYPFER